jgi:hypothetical protein
MGLELGRGCARQYCASLRTSPEGYPRSRLAAIPTAFSLTFPVALRIVPSVAFGENSGIRLGRFLFRVSLRFCWISPFLDPVLSRCRPSSPGSFTVCTPLRGFRRSHFTPVSCLFSLHGRQFPQFKPFRGDTIDEAASHLHAYHRSAQRHPPSCARASISSGASQYPNSSTSGTYFDRNAAIEPARSY